VDVSPANFFIEPGGAGVDELQTEMGAGFIITEFEGLHSGLSSVSGDFSLPARGFWFENGEKAHAVEQVVVSGNFFDVLKDVAAVGNDLEWGMPSGTCFGSPSLLIGRMQVAGA